MRGLGAVAVASLVATGQAAAGDGEAGRIPPLREVRVAITYKRPPKPLPSNGVVLVSSEATAHEWFDAATVRRLIANVDFSNENFVIVSWLKSKGGSLAHEIPSGKRSNDIEFYVTAPLGYRDDVLANRYFAVPKSSGVSFRLRVSR